MPSIRTRFILVLLILFVTLLFQVNAEESSTEDTAKDSAGDLSDPRLIYYDNLSPLWQARIRAHCGHYTGAEPPEDTSCLTHTLSTLVLADSRKEALQDNDQSDPEKDAFWDEVVALLYDLSEAIPFHPLCIDKLPITPLGGVDPDTRIAQCDEHYPSPIVVRESGWFLSQYPDDEDGNSMGWAAYRVVERAEADYDYGGTNIWIEATLNTGGTGHFDGIWQLHLPANQDMTRPRFAWIHQIGGGDRCNDGKSAIAEITPSTVTYQYAATPYRLLNPGNEDNTFLAYIIGMLEQEAMESGNIKEASELSQTASSVSSDTFMGWLAYDDVVNCAICCVGWLIESVDLDSGERWLERIVIDSEFANVEFFVEPTLAECAAPWLASLESEVADRGTIRFSPDDWLIKRDELIEACQGVEP